ncbi:MAG: hypothetical protein ACLP19_05240 [Xanthobacteraceae bacterium]
MIYQKVAPLGFSELMVSTSAVGFSAVPTNADMVFVVAEGTGRWRDDGTVPSVTSGALITPTQPPLQYSGDLGAFRVIAASGTISLGCSFYQLVG